MKRSNPMTAAMTAASVLSDTALGGRLLVEELNAASETDWPMGGVESVSPALEFEVAEAVLITALTVVNTVSLRGSVVEL